MLKRVFGCFAVVLLAVAMQQPVAAQNNADFDGDGTVGFADFLEFAGQFGAQQGDGRYQAKYDLNSDGAIDFADFLLFASSYGNTVPPSGGGGGTPKMYWTDHGTDKIQRADLDGSNVEDLITTGLLGPKGIALDVGRGKMYWTDWDTEKIQRADLDGSNVEDLITRSAGLRGPFGIALDVGRGKMYWTDFVTDKIQRANLNGSNVEDLITTGLLGPQGIALDVGRGKMYWTDWGTDKIQRANLDGSNVEDLITTGVRRPSGIALDVGRGKMYWMDGDFYGRTNKIQRANLDGSNVEDLITTGLDLPRGIALDVGRGKMYWTDGRTDKIQRANLDGSNVEDLITFTGLSGPDGIALDTQGTSSGGGSPDLIVESPSVSESTLTPGQSFTLYATVRNRGTGRSASTTLRYYQSSDATISTSDTEVGTDSVSGLSASGTGSEAIHLTAPSRAGTYYYGACVEAVSGESNTDNNCLTGVRVTVSSGGGGGTPKMYWTNSGAQKIQRANLDGSNVEDLITTGLGTPEGIALDVGRGKMYWTDIITDKIQRANLDGSYVEDLITTGLDLPDDIALDVGRGKMYWTDARYDRSTRSYTYQIQRANLDGSNVEDLITRSAGLSYPRGIALDVGRGKMYWTDTGTEKIQRANLDGSNVEDLITTGLGTPEGIALDVGRGKMYWIDASFKRIQRANLDGSNVEDLITRSAGLIGPYGIALDVGRGKMYWTDGFTNKIQRANLDGSNVEDLLTRSAGLSNPYGIALDTQGTGSAGGGGSSGSGGGSSDDHSNTRSGATSLSLGGSRSGRIQTGDDVDYFRVQVSSSGTLTVYTTGNVDTYGKLQSSSGSTLETDDNDGFGTNFSIARSVSAGTYYIAVLGFSSSAASYTVHARFLQSGGGRPDLIVESLSTGSQIGQFFTLDATVRNRGTAWAAATTLTYYDGTPGQSGIVGTVSVSDLSASATSRYSILRPVPSRAGTYSYYACVDAVSGESDTSNNCSASVRVTVYAVP